jgi:hypothetical protein
MQADEAELSYFCIRLESFDNRIASLGEALPILARL